MFVVFPIAYNKEPNVTAPNEQRMVNGKSIIVSLIAGQCVTVSVFDPGSQPLPSVVSIDPLLKGGLDEQDALDFVMGIAVIATLGATS